MEIMGRGNATGLKCILKFIPYSYFSKESQRRVKGAVMDSTGKVRWIINGKSLILYLGNLWHTFSLHRYVGR